MDDLAFGLGLWQGLTFADLASLGAEAEELGYSSVWYANHKLYRDMLVGLTVLATATTRVRLGTFVAEPYSLHPALTAAAVASLDEVAGGRLLLGLGTGGANFKELGIQRTRPARAMAESIDVMRRLLSGERLTYQGELFSVVDAWLHLPAHPNVPIIVASRGDLVLQVGGRLADGVMLSTYATPRGQQHARQMVARGAQQAGRDPAEVHQIIRVDLALHEDAELARAQVKPMIASSLMNSYPDTRFVEQVGLELTPELAEMCRRKDEAESFASGHLVPDTFVREFAWAGTPDQVATQIAPIVELGIHDILVMPHPLDRDPRPTIRAFAQQVVPRLHALFV